MKRTRPEGQKARQLDSPRRWDSRVGIVGQRCGFVSWRRAGERPWAWARAGGNAGRVEAGGVQVLRHRDQYGVAKWSSVLAPGTIMQGRGLEPHSTTQKFLRGRELNPGLPRDRRKY